jgi:Fic family protein
VPGWHFGDDPPDERAELEAEGGERQARSVLLLARFSRHSMESARLKPSQVLFLHRIAMRRILPTAGELRTRSDLKIEGSMHLLPPHKEVPALLQDACDFVNAQTGVPPLAVAAYILWRICWVHPFEDGNGWTARAVSYLVLSQRLGMELPGKHPIPQRIKYAPIAYQRALEAADAAWARKVLDVSVLQNLLTFYLIAQLNDDPPGLPPGA